MIEDTQLTQFLVKPLASERVIWATDGEKAYDLDDRGHGYCRNKEEEASKLVSIIDHLEQRLKQIAPQVEVERSYSKCHKKYSEWSRQISPYGTKSAEETLKSIFHIESEQWERCFKEAVSGYENDRIMTLHSSALLSLLCFSQVSENNPLIYEGIKYVHAFFEVKNKVFYGPSSVDVVLKSEDGDLLFLESKFTEYLEGDKPKIKEKYYYFYHSILSNHSDFPINLVFPCKWKDKGEDVIGYSLWTNFPYEKGQLAYCEGIKQCFSHLIGIAKGPYDPGSKCWENSEKGKLTFGTILFQIRGESFNIYKRLYANTIGKISPSDIKKGLGGDCIQSNIDRLNILPNVLTYQDLFSYKENRYFLSLKVKEFYGFE